MTGIEIEHMLAVVSDLGAMHAAFWTDDGDEVGATDVPSPTAAAARALPHSLPSADELPSRNVVDIANAFGDAFLSSRIWRHMPSSWMSHAAAAIALAPLIADYLESDAAPKTLLHHDLRGVRVSTLPFGFVLFFHFHKRNTTIVLLCLVLFINHRMMR